MAFNIFGNDKVLNPNFSRNFFSFVYSINETRQKFCVFEVVVYLSQKSRICSFSLLHKTPAGLRMNSRNLNWYNRVEPKPQILFQPFPSSVFQTIKYCNHEYK